MAVSIDRKLNIVVPLDTADGEIYVHSVPIARAVFDQFYSVIAKTFSVIYSERYGIIAGPRIAAHVLRDVATEDGKWPDVQQGLVGEIRRLTNVVVPAKNGKGWETLMFEDAVTLGRVTPDDEAEVMNILTFFIVVSAMHTRRDLPGVLDGASKLWGGRTSSLNCMEFAGSLRTSTAVESSGEKPAKPLSLPS